tara:strand:- start:159 stop:443 length:285 start_codon:yes stop_codon:yes gene_type:complete
LHFFISQPVAVVFIFSGVDLRGWMMTMKIELKPGMLFKWEGYRGSQKCIEYVIITEMTNNEVHFYCLCLKKQVSTSEDQFQNSIKSNIWKLISK